MKNRLPNTLAFKLALIVLLVGFSHLYKISAQTSTDNAESQLPIIPEVIQQNDCPLLITVVNVDNSSPSFQKIVFTVQNISNKSIRAFTILNGAITTAFSASRFFEIGEISTEEAFIERENIKPNKKFSLSVDFVEFADRTSWGLDTNKESERIKGFNTGQKTAIEQVKDFIKNRDELSITKILQQEAGQIEAPLPDPNQNDKWKKGFQMGYKSVISLLQRLKQQKLSDISAKIDDLEKLTN